MDGQTTRRRTWALVAAVSAFLLLVGAVAVAATGDDGGSGGSGDVAAGTDDTGDTGADHSDHEGHTGTTTDHSGHTKSTTKTKSGATSEHDGHTGTTVRGRAASTTHDGHTGTTSGGSTTGSHTGSHTGSQGTTTPTSGGHDHHSTPTTSGSSTTPTTSHDHTTPTTSGSTTPTTSHDHSSTTTTLPGTGYLSYLPVQTIAEIDVARDLAMDYPTAEFAERAGWHKITISLPGIAAHYINMSYLDGTFDLYHPEVLLYGGEGPDAPLVGVNYIVSGSTAPAGFYGDYDHWHVHPTLCFNPTLGLIVGDESVDAQECADLGGFLINFSNNWLLHVWCIPGWEAPEGVFSHENSLVV